jgi:uncharacterized membrane protein
VSVEELTLAGFQAVVLVVFLVQTIIEAIPSLRGRWTPLVAAVVGVIIAAVTQYAPSSLQNTLGAGLALAASASLAVRYVKRADAPPGGSGGGSGIIVDFGPSERQ